MSVQCCLLSSSVHVVPCAGRKWCAKRRAACYALSRDCLASRDILGYPGINGVGISWDCVGYKCVNTSVGPSVHHTSPPSTTCGVRERSNATPGRPTRSQAATPSTKKPALVPCLSPAAPRNMQHTQCEGAAECAHSTQAGRDAGTDAPQLRYASSARVRRRLCGASRAGKCCMKRSKNVQQNTKGTKSCRMKPLTLSHVLHDETVLSNLKHVSSYCECAARGSLYFIASGSTREPLLQRSFRWKK